MEDFRAASIALYEYDASDIEFTVDYESAEEMKVVKAFAYATREYNDYANVVNYLRVGPPNPQPGFDLSFVRKVINRWRELNKEEDNG